MAFSLPFSPQVDIIRAHTKDEEYIDLVHKNLQDVLVNILPNAMLSRPRVASLISRVTRLLYHALTPNGAVPTTPGEEYASTLCVHADKSAHRLIIPTNVTRFILAILYLVTRADVLRIIAYIWRFFVAHVILARRAQLNGRGERIGARLNDMEFIEQTHPFPRTAVSAVLDVVARVHLALFYWSGRYYSLADRVLRVRRVQTAAEAGGTAPVGVRILAVPVLAQLIAEALRATRRAMRRVHTPYGRDGNLNVSHKYWMEKLKAVFWPEIVAIQSRDSNTDNASADNGAGNGAGNGSRENACRHTSKKCTLCLEVVHDPTVTTCGHVFCWDCICNWCSSNVSCYILRLWYLVPRIRAKF